MIDHNACEPSDDEYNCEADVAEKVFVDSQPNWETDLAMHLDVSMRALAAYFGIEFVDGRLSEIACEAIDVAAAQMLAEIQAGRIIRVTWGDRPDFCCWTPTRND